MTNGLKNEEFIFSHRRRQRVSVCGVMSVAQQCHQDLIPSRVPICHPFWVGLPSSKLAPHGSRMVPVWYQLFLGLFPHNGTQGREEAAGEQAFLPAVALLWECLFSGPVLIPHGPVRTSALVRGPRSECPIERTPMLFLRRERQTLLFALRWWRSSDFCRFSSTSTDWPDICRENLYLSLEGMRKIIWKKQHTRTKPHSLYAWS